MDFKAKVVHKKQLAGNIYELRVQLIAPQHLDFIAGQFVIFTIGQKIRAYSVASAPQSSGGLLDFCIDISPGGIGSKFVDNLQTGDSFELQGPFGFFHLKKLPEQKNILLVATGAGVAPFKAIIEDTLQNHAGNFTRKVDLLFGVRNEQALFYENYFANLASEHQNFRFIPALSQPSASWTGYSGRVTKYLQEHFNEYRDWQILICGSAEMVKDTRSLLLQKGMPGTQIKLEVFN